MRILIFHGYLLRGTGSNIYNASLVRALARLGHQVELVCQERDPGPLGLPDAVRITVPDIGGVLPVYVADRYEGYRAVPYAELDDEGVERYIAANVSAVRKVVEDTRPDLALANHLVMGPVILARALEGRVPYAVKVHGQRARVHRAAASRALPALRAGGAPRRERGARGLAAHRGEPLGGDGRGPCRIERSPSPILTALDAQADPCETAAPRALHSMAARPDSMFGIHFGISMGETRRGPSLCNVSTSVSTVPTPPSPLQR